MRIAFFSPLPPARSGIADYSDTLLEHLKPLVDVQVFTDVPTQFDPTQYDICLYQLGNNPFHTFAYEAATKYPGVVVLHEANLHHLIADLTIRRGNWDGYLHELEVDGGPQARAYGERYVRPQRRGPNYDQPMLKSIVTRSLGVIVHSETVAVAVRNTGFTGPIAKIPHGAWVIDSGTVARDGELWRSKLGIAPATPLFGVFGFLKPYKRVAEILRAFRRIIDKHPEARLILVGEAHPELPLSSMLSSLGLNRNVQHIDYAPIEDFNGYLAACDGILNLRFPTVGETSGTLLRSLGMGKPILVSDIGAFAEYPDDICLKVPIDASEVEHIYQYLDLLISRPAVGRALGTRARDWVAQECNWPSVAGRYLSFMNSVVNGSAASIDKAIPAEPVPATSEPVPADYILSWTREEDGTRKYAETHRTRLEKTLAVTPRGGPEDRILEMGAYLQITPALKSKLGYGDVRGCYFGTLGKVDERTVTSDDGEEFTCLIDHFDAEKDRFPYEDGSFATILCCELVEHLPSDPMHMMSEIHRILRPGGHLVLTTPNVASMRALAGILQGYHPMLFPAYIRPNPNGEADPRHAREYTPREMQSLFEDSGFEVTLLDTGAFLAEPTPELGWVTHLLERYILTQDHRGDGIYIVGRKTGPVRDRYPAWLYS